MPAGRQGFQYRSNPRTEQRRPKIMGLGAGDVGQDLGVEDVAASTAVASIGAGSASDKRSPFIERPKDPTVSPP